MIYRGPGFLAVSLSQSSCVSPVELTDGRGGEEEDEEANHTTARKPGPLQIIQYSLTILQSRPAGTDTNFVQRFTDAFSTRCPMFQFMDQISIKTPNP
jgi:hypothetical protein